MEQDGATQEQAEQAASGAPFAIEGPRGRMTFAGVAEISVGAAGELWLMDGDGGTIACLAPGAWWFVVAARA